MRVAVTGASGYIGRHVVKVLASSRDVDVVATSRQRPADLPEAVTHVPMDIGAPPPDAYDALGRPDVVVHLAWSGLPNYMSLHHFEDEAPKQYAFLKSLVTGGLTSLLVTGTCYEYGLVDGPLDEALESVPSNPYAHAKTTLRRNLEFLKARHPFDLTWARLFYSYGDGQADSSIYSLLKAAAARGDRTFPMSGGQQLRDFLPIEMVASHLVNLALKRHDIGVVNVCSGFPVSIRALVEGWIEANGWTISPDLGKYPYPSYEPMAFWGSAARLSGLSNPPGQVD